MLAHARAFASPDAPPLCLEKLRHGGKRQRIQPLLPLPRKVHQDHADDIPCVPVAMARHDHSVTVNFFPGAANEVDGHFRPERKGLSRSELQAIFPYADVLRGQSELGPIFLEHLENPRGV